MVPPRGYGQIVEAVAKTAVDAGGRSSATRDTNVIPAGDGVAVGLDNGDTLDGEAVVDRDAGDVVDG